MREDAVEADKARLILSETAPSNALELLQRLAVRKPDITPVRARAILEAAGANASPALCSAIISDTRKVPRYLAKQGLLIDDFERRRRWAPSDFEEIAPRKRRRRE